MLYVIMRQEDNKIATRDGWSADLAEAQIYMGHELPKHIHGWTRFDIVTETEYYGGKEQDMAFVVDVEQLSLPERRELGLATQHGHLIHAGSKIAGLGIDICAWATNGKSTNNLELIEKLEEISHLIGMIYAAATED